MINGKKAANRSLRWGMIGGGGTSQIGYIHRSAAQRDGNFVLLAGAFDLDAVRGREFGQALGVAPERCYPDYASLFAGEAGREDGIEAVSIATPTIPISPSVGRHSMPGYMLYARSRSVLRSKRPMSWSS